MFIRRKAIFSMLKIGEDGFAVFQIALSKMSKRQIHFFLGMHRIIFATV